MQKGRETRITDTAREQWSTQSWFWLYKPKRVGVIGRIVFHISIPVEGLRIS